MLNLAPLLPCCLLLPCRAMLSGQEPWAGLDCVSLAYRVAYGGERPPLDAIPPDRRPPKLVRLVAQCWEADPKRRPAVSAHVCMCV